jgi:hypothetical protein
MIACTLGNDYHARSTDKTVRIPYYEVISIEYTTELKYTNAWIEIYFSFSHCSCLPKCKCSTQRLSFPNRQRNDSNPLFSKKIKDFTIQRHCYTVIT